MNEELKNITSYAGLVFFIWVALTSAKRHGYHVYTVGSVGLRQRTATIRPSA